MAAEFYEVSEELETIARELIQDHHSHLVEARIKYLFRTGNWEVKKRETWGQAKKVGKEVNYLTGYDFIVTIHRDVWDQLEGKEKRALLDHELQHCSAGSDDAGNKIWYIQGHDVEDFYAIIKRHGLWSKSLRKMDSLLKQTELDFGPNTIPGPLQLEGGEELLQLNVGRPVLMLTTGADDEHQEDPEDVIDAEIVDSDAGSSPEDVTPLGGTGTEG